MLLVDFKDLMQSRDLVRGPWPELPIDHASCALLHKSYNPFRARMKEAKEELDGILSDDRTRDTILLIFNNKVTIFTTFFTQIFFMYYDYPLF